MLSDVVKLIRFRNLRFELFFLLALLPLHSQAQPLEYLISSVLSSHPAGTVQGALVQSAQAGLDGARWQFYPTPSISVEAANARASDPSYRGDSRVATARLQQPLWTGGRLSAGWDKAEAGLQLSQAALADTRLQLGLRVIQAYGDWMAAHLKTRSLETSLATHRRLRDQVKRRLEEGTSAEIDLTLSESRLDAVLAETSAVQTQGEVALARLGQLLGRPVDGPALVKAIATSRPLGESAQEMMNQALAINPSLTKAKAQAKVQEAAIAVRRADLSPEVYARLERQYGNYNFPNAAPENRAFIGLVSRFGAGLSTLSNVEAELSQYAAALSEIEVQSRSISEQVLADYALALSMTSRIKAVLASFQSAQTVSLSYDRQYLAGRKSWLDVMNAARELSQSEMQLAELQSTQVVVTWRLDAYTKGIAALSMGMK